MSSWAVGACACPLRGERIVAVAVPGACGRLLGGLWRRLRIVLLRHLAGVPSGLWRAPARPFALVRGSRLVVRCLAGPLARQAREALGQQVARKQSREAGDPAAP